MKKFNESKKHLATQWGEFAEQTTYNDLPRKVQDYAKTLILDLLGCIIGGRHIESSQIASKVAMTLGGNPQSTVIGYNTKVSAPWAAFINGVTGHAFDMDDDHREGTLHSSVAVFPAVLAMAETLGATGKDVITAYVLGSELMIRLGESFLGQTYYQGFHPTGTTGVFGATLGAGKILGLNAAQLATAQGIAGSEAAGLLEWKADGSWTKRFQAGYAAMNGILPALLARDGYTGPSSIYEGKDGFVRAYSYQDKFDVFRINNRLGEKWEFADNSIKPHACCRFACPIVDCAIDISKNNELNPSDIEDVIVKCNKWMITILTEPSGRKYHPETVVDAQFSLPYAAAVGLVKKRASVPEFTNASIKDPEILTLMQKVRYELDPEAEKVYPEKYPSTVIVTMKDGKKYSSYIEHPKGDPENPINREELLAKFRLLSSFNMQAKRAENIIDLVSNLEQIKNINELTDLLR
ncbi:MmgE/PrpD family protein [Lutispora sp.]|uniref:MmgE/PrpD family protein n=1 Tax=Lutispora sp. TaxID=2828727 RepID=UPI002B1F7FA0|nr:MmgE/PrpD family protein [Lutispora sp.]MEA4961725.1 MmgE/PrpD family protein [Lutispora sp.]